MSANDYRFVTDWRVYGTLQEVADVLSRPEDFLPGAAVADRLPSRSNPALLRS